MFPIIFFNFFFFFFWGGGQSIFISGGPFLFKVSFFLNLLFQKFIIFFLIKSMNYSKFFSNFKFLITHSFTHFALFFVVALFFCAAAVFGVPLGFAELVVWPSFLASEFREYAIHIPWKLVLVTLASEKYVAHMWKWH